MRYPFNTCFILLLLWFAAAASLLLTACGGQDAKNNAVSMAKKTTESSADYLSISGDSVLLPPFTIVVQLSKNAEEKLLTDNETLIIAASFSGQPKDTLSAEYHEWGSLPLATVIIETDTVRTILFDHVKFARTKLDSLAHKDISVLVNVRSGRHSTPDNLLDCSILFDKMSVVRMRTVPLTGRLINEADSLAR
jgi:hypothetical protein